MNSTNHDECHPVRTEDYIRPIPSNEWDKKHVPDLRYPNVLPGIRTRLENIQQKVNNKVDTLLDGIYPLVNRILRVFK